MAVKSSSPDHSLREPAQRRQFLREQRYDRLVFVAVALAAAAAGWVYRDYAPDDAFITYRFAQNLAFGRGFVFNPGEPVLGTSTPLYTLLLAGGYWLTRINIPPLSNLLGVASLAGASMMFYGLGRTLDRRMALAGALLFVTNPILLASFGMETLFLLLCQMAALTAYVGGRRTVTAGLLGALVLLRYEMILFAGLIALTDWLRARRFPGWLWPAGAIVAGWLAYALLTFGQIIPQSALAKIAAPRLPFLVGGLVIWDIYARQLPAFYFLLILTVLGAYSLARTRLIKLVPAYRLLLAWGGLYLIAAGLVAGSFPWYYAPLVPAVIVIVVAGITVLIEMIVEIAPAGRARPLGAATFTILMAGICILNIAAWTRAWVARPGTVVDPRVVAYRELADWLNANAPPGASLASFEIGAIGYFTDLYVIDLSGLISPEVQPLLDNPDRAQRLREAITIFEPDFLLVPPDVVVDFFPSESGTEPVYTAGGIELYVLPE